MACAVIAIVGGVISTGLGGLFGYKYSKAKKDGEKIKEESKTFSENIVPYRSLSTSSSPAKSTTLTTPTNTSVARPIPGHFILSYTPSSASTDLVDVFPQKIHTTSIMVPTPEYGLSFNIDPNSRSHWVTPHIGIQMREEKKSKMKFSKTPVKSFIINPEVFLNMKPSPDQGSMTIAGPNLTLGDRFTTAYLNKAMMPLVQSMAGDIITVDNKLKSLGIQAPDLPMGGSGVFAMEHRTMGKRPLMFLSRDYNDSVVVDDVDTDPLNIANRHFALRVKDNEDSRTGNIIGAGIFGSAGVAILSYGIYRAVKS